VAEVELREVTRHFEGAPAPAVKGLSLRIQSGELMVVVGPSGCGKSTALRMVAGLDEPDRGDLAIGGVSMKGVPPQDRDVAMVFQGYALYPHMKVRDIIGFPLKMRKTPKDQRDRAVAEAAELLSITRLLDRRPHELSGGERQRVAMGRAIVRKPKVFLFDEPLSNLDAALRGDIRVEIGALVDRLGATTLYVTHDHVEAMTLGDRIAIMRAGELEQVGTPREVYETPATAFVASFLGSPSMNLSPARREGDEVVAHGIRLKLQGDAPSDEELLIGVRPEHVRVGDDAPSKHVRLTARVTAVEPLGAETFVHFDAGGATLRARLPGFDAPSRGDDVPLHFAPEHVHAFSSQARGERLALAMEAV